MKELYFIASTKKNRKSDMKISKGIKFAVMITSRKKVFQFLVLDTIRFPVLYEYIFNILPLFSMYFFILDNKISSKHDRNKLINKRCTVTDITFKLISTAGLRYNANAWRWLWEISCIYCTRCSMRTWSSKSCREDTPEELDVEAITGLVDANATGKEIDMSSAPFKY